MACPVEPWKQCNFEERKEAEHSRYHADGRGLRGGRKELEDAAAFSRKPYFM